MSNHPRRLAPWRPRTRGAISLSRGLTLRAHLRGHLDQAGCTCEPDFDIDPQPDSDGLTRVHIRHDGWCRLLARINREAN